MAIGFAGTHLPLVCFLAEHILWSLNTPIYANLSFTSQFIMRIRLSDICHNQSSKTLLSASSVRSLLQLRLLSNVASLAEHAKPDCMSSIYEFYHQRPAT